MKALSSFNAKPAAPARGATAHRFRPTLGHVLALLVLLALLVWGGLFLVIKLVFGALH
jgi:hypothetical protein